MSKKNELFRFGMLVVLSLLVLCSCTRENSRDGHVIRNAVKDIDGNNYDAVKIGNQVWMKSNLRTTHFRDGSPIPKGSNYDDTSSSSYFAPSTGQVPSYNEETYGLYYNWSAVDDSRGLCPQGWHVPTDAEWTELENYIGSKSEYVYGSDPENIAKALASEVGWKESNVPGTPGCEPEKNNATGFSAVPAGLRFIAGLWLMEVYDVSGFITYYWSSTKRNDRYAYGRILSYHETILERSDMDGIANVRCVRY